MRAEKLEPQIRFTRQRDIDVDVGETSWLSPPAAPLAMIDGRPSSEYEPDPDLVDYFYLHRRLPRSLLHQGLP
ncbi:hypothetical protein INS49_010200 [Diaporthe citri]|uniref:uncharacterized protein n=1 Tax=Diaporthe citri TaxID=83186 RepID=UPI001C80A943|nr:uncharacterized protein INS49_010200 [Diaporthe citri]KAG6361971.1 hypothetical protein INS49_010200 [Diaporthe citri]